MKIHIIDHYPCTASNAIDRSLYLNHEFDREQAALLAARALIRPQPAREPVTLTETMVLAMDDTAGLCEPVIDTDTQETPK